MMIAFSDKQKSVIPLILATLICCSCFISPAYAADVEAPELHPQDTWAYVDIHEVKGVGRPIHIEANVIRAGPSGILISIKEVGSTISPKEVLWGPDWSKSKSINGQQKVISKALNFPLSIGKTWVVDYNEDHPDREKKSQHTHVKYEVVGWEKVTVPAGTFNAVKIEADGEWTAEIEPATTAATVARTDEQGATAIANTNKVLPKTATGRLYKAYWYSPDVKRFVKLDEESYSSNNILNARDTEELESYKLSQ